MCAILGFLLERHSQETDIKTFGSAIFWTTTQLLTVSSQIKNPISTGGRVLDIFMEIWAVSVIATLAVTRYMAAQLYGVSPADPMSFAVTAAILCAVTLVAIYIPARRAMTVDPMVALHYE